MISDALTNSEDNLYNEVVVNHDHVQAINLVVGEIYEHRTSFLGVFRLRKGQVSMFNVPW